LIIPLDAGKKEATMSECRLCEGPCNERILPGRNVPEYWIDCARCGTYVLSDPALHLLHEAYVKEHIHLLSAMTRRSWEHGDNLLIDEQLLGDRPEFEARVLSQCPKRVGEKLDRILLYLEEHSPHPGSEVKVDLAKDYPLFFCYGSDELAFHLHHLKDSDMIDLQGFVSGDPWILTLSTAGWQYVEELQKPNVESKQAFVAMWFDAQLDCAYAEGIAKLEEDTGFRPLRIDMKQFNEKICDQIIAEVRRSRFLIADVTGHRQGVYFEAGFAMGLGLPVIWTCRKDHIDECHFDTRQYNHITWETPEELREKLKNRILATIGLAH
jgi:nucleoside 2-deoxyribosyltransferase